MLLVTNNEFTRLLMCSGYGDTTFNAKIYYDSLDSLLDKYCSGIRSAEMFWQGNTQGIYNVLTKHRIEAVRSVNKIQSGMKILYVISDANALLIDIIKMQDGTTFVRDNNTGRRNLW